MAAEREGCMAGTKQKSLKLNFLMNTIAAISSVVVPLITFPYISRILLPEAKGKVTFAIGLVSYFHVFAQMGIPTYGIQLCAKIRDDERELTKAVHELFFINICMTALSYVALAIFLHFVPKLRAEKNLYIIISTTIFLVTIGIEWFYKALEEYVYITKWSLIAKVIAVGAIFLLVKREEDYIIYAVITAATSLTSIINIVHSRKFISWKPIGNYQIKKHFKYIVVFGAMTFATTLYTNLDTVMLGFLSKYQEVGYYDAAVKIKTVLVCLVTSLGSVLMPRASYYVQNKMWDDFWRIASKAVNYVFLVALPMVVYFIFFAKQGIRLLPGEAYDAAIVPMQVIMPTLLLVGITDIISTQILIPLGKERIVLYSRIFGALTDMVLNFILIPGLGAVGAAVGTLVAEAVVLGIQFLAQRKEISFIFREVKYLKMVVALLLGMAGAFWVLWTPLGNFLSVLISGVLFLGIYGISLLVMKEPLLEETVDQSVKILKKILKK